MSWKDCEEQTRVVEILKKSVQRNRTAHAYLFSGPRGVGKSKVALQFAKSLFCLEQDGDSCEQCANCQRIHNGNHPDVHRISPDGASIKIEQIRNLQKEFSYRAMESQQKVYMIEQAETMTTQAANSLLKFLEEPASKVTAILMTESTHSLLPTILSRCQIITFSQPSAEKVATRLIEEGFSESLVRVASQITVGEEEARELCQSEWFAQLRSLVIQLSQDVLDRGSYALLTLQEKIIKYDKAKEELPLLLDLYLIWLRDLMFWHAGRQDKIANRDQTEQLKKQAMRLDMLRLVQGMEQILAAKMRLERNANPQLSLERMVLYLQEG